MYDVLAVTRVTSGVALDGKAHLVAALDTLSAAAGPQGGACVGVVTYTTRDGVTRPVLVGEAALLPYEKKKPRYPGFGTSISRFYPRYPGLWIPWRFCV